MTLRRIAPCVLASVLGLVVFVLATSQPLRCQSRGVALGWLVAQPDPHSVTLPVVEGHDLRFQRLSTAQGLSQTAVPTITQDDLGFIWFATQYGLNRYDGYKFRVFAREQGRSDSLSGVFVRSLFKDRDGVLWVGCDHFLDRFDPLTETFTHYVVKSRDEIGPGATVEDISQDRRGILWLSSKDGLYSLDPVNGSIERYVHDPNNPHSLSSNYILATREDREGTLWVSTVEGLDAYNPTTRTVSIHISKHADGQEMSFFEDSFGFFWIFHSARGSGLSVYDRRTNKLTEYVMKPSGGSQANVAGVRCVLEDRDRNLWLATGNDGLYKFDRKHRQFIRYRNEPNNGESISDNELLTLFQDREGNIWVGLAQMAPNYFSTKPRIFEKFVHQPGTVNNLGESLVTNIFEDRQGILWISTNNSLNRINRTTGENLLVFHGNGEIHTIMQDSAGVLWVGTSSRGIQQIDEQTGQFKGHIDRVFDSSNSIGLPVTRLQADSGGTMWAATWDGLMNFDLSRHRYKLYKPSIQGTAEYYDLAQDRNGILWLGGKEGLHRFDPRSGLFTVYAHSAGDPHSLSDSQVNSVHFDGPGTMWVGTQDGLNKFDPTTGSFEIYRVRDGLPGNVVSCILSDNYDGLWMSTNNGISRFDLKSKHFRNYSVAEGLSGADLSGWGACFKSRSGEMFFGGFGGATAFYPDRVVESTDVPHVVLTNFNLAGVPVEVGPHSLLEKSISFADKLTLSHRQNIFSVEFSALSYLNSGANRYRYRLDGLDQSWNEVDVGQRQAGYTTLPSGEYTFWVQGSINGGPWGEPGTVLQITVLPPWWNTWWFRILYIMTALLILRSAYRLRLHQIAAQLNMRLEERLAERNRIARELHDTLLQGFQGLMLRFQAVMEEIPVSQPARAKMEKVLERADEVLLEGRERVSTLRAAARPGEDLSQAIASCGEELAQNHPAQFGMAIVGTPQPLDPVILDEAHRIGREALVNAFCHSDALKIEGEITYDSGRVRLSIRDNGKGIDPGILKSGRAGHWGLSGMRERADNLGAQLNIWSSPGAGTEVELILPSKVAYQRGRKRLRWQWIKRAVSGGR
jgi:ligand-binding sensor domain-containing protein/signal transduction histidine kinase